LLGTGCNDYQAGNSMITASNANINGAHFRIEYAPLILDLLRKSPMTVEATDPFATGMRLFFMGVGLVKVVNVFID
jgi:hypothetical protein